MRSYDTRKNVKIVFTPYFQSMKCSKNRIFITICSPQWKKPYFQDGFYSCPSFQSPEFPPAIGTSMAYLCSSFTRRLQGTWAGHDGHGPKQGMSWDM